jgi:hypothetical protein
VEVDLPSFSLENPEFHETCFVANKLSRGCKNTNSVLHASAKSDGRSFLEVFRWTRNFSNSKAKGHGLRQDFVIEDEIV